MNPKDTPAESTEVTQQQKEEMEKNVIRTIPDETHAVQEWGDRHGTAKGVATGGKEGHKAGNARADPPPEE